MSKLEESAFELSGKEMKQIRYLEMLKQRKADKKKGKRLFSAKLSTEAQLAMVMALDDTLNNQKETHEGEKKTTPMEKNELHKIDTGSKLNVFSEVTSSSAKSSMSQNSTRKKSFSELYEENSTSRMKNDITDKTFKPERLHKRALNPYAKLQSAMEIVETVRCDMDDPSSDDDNEFIDQIAQQNSVDKCKIWISAKFTITEW